MKICYVTHAFNANARFGGVESYLAGLVKEISADGEIYIFSAGQKDAEIKNLCRIQANYKASLKPPLKKNHDILVGIKFRRYMQEIRPDIVHIQHLWGLSDFIPQILKEMKIPYLITIWDFYSICPKIFLIKQDLSACSGLEEISHCRDCYGGNKKKVAGWLEERRDTWQDNLDAARLIIAPSIFVQEKIREVLPGLKGKIELLKPGLGVACKNMASKSNLLQEDNPKARALRLGYFGSIHKAKGVYMLADCIRRFSKSAVTLDIYGHPISCKDKILIRLLSMLPNIKFHGPYRHKTVASLMGNIDFTVVPSFAQESFCFVAHESLASGVPVISSNRGALTEVVSHGRNGFIFDPSGKGALEGLIKALIRNPGLKSGLAMDSPSFTSMREHSCDLMRKYKYLSGAGN